MRKDAEKKIDSAERFRIKWTSVTGVDIMKDLAEVHGNRTHLPGYSPDTPDLKSGRATRALSTSVVERNLIVIDPKNNFIILTSVQTFF